MLAIDQRNALYDDSYALGQADPDADRNRALGYEQQIRGFLRREGVPVPVGRSMVEFGCGTGALLELLAAGWEVREAIGVEAASTLAAEAAGKATGSVRVVKGYAEQADVGTSHALVLSVNVVEHAFEPFAFVSAARRAIDADGVVLVVCPDGERPGSELLFVDHISSFSTASMEVIAARAGLVVVASEPLSGQQDGFRIYLLRHAWQSSGSSCNSGGEELARGRSEYLAAWGTMEEATLARFAGTRYAIFGIGEYSDLLSAYCPGIVEGAEFFVVDRPVQGEKHGRAVVSLEHFLQRDSLPLLTAVHPRNWRALSQRLAALGRETFHPYQFTSLGSKL